MSAAARFVRLSLRDPDRLRLKAPNHASVVSFDGDAGAPRSLTSLNAPNGSFLRSCIPGLCRGEDASAQPEHPEQLSLPGSPRPKRCHVSSGEYRSTLANSAFGRRLIRPLTG